MMGSWSGIANRPGLGVIVKCAFRKQAKRFVVLAPEALYHAEVIWALAYELRRNVTDGCSPTHLFNLPRISGNNKVLHLSPR